MAARRWRHGDRVARGASRSLDTNELAQNLSKNHPRPSFLETSHISEVKGRRERAFDGGNVVKGMFIGISILFSSIKS